MSEIISYTHKIILDIVQNILMPIMMNYLQKLVAHQVPLLP